jgi:hypothetical protein
MTNEEKRTCLYCDRDDTETPLVVLEFRGAPLRICPQHLPMLIHDPAKLIGKLPGAEGLSPADK